MFIEVASSFRPLQKNKQKDKYSFSDGFFPIGVNPKIALLSQDVYTLKDTHEHVRSHSKEHFTLPQMISLQGKHSFLYKENP